MQLLLKRDFDSKAEIIEAFLAYSIHAFPLVAVPAFEHLKHCQEEYMKMCRKFSVVCINSTRALDFKNDKSS